MFLKSLELTGFKSFAKRTVLSFEPARPGSIGGITAVVGPNGSGKSNIADAIRWVLGAQSKKAVRGKVGSDVIFSGTGKRPAMGLAEVSLTFDNTKSAGVSDSHQLPYDYDEVVVTRRLYRSGDSEYLVNGGSVRLTDLQHAFAVAGIGAENYTVIGQGMVDQALNQSAKERRGLFEEAAGVRQFQLKRDEARRKLAETTTNLSRVEDIVGELSPRLKLLRRQASALEQKEAVEQALRDAYRARYGHRYRRLDGELGTIKAKQQEVGREFVAIERELAELTAEVEKLRRSRQGRTLHELLAQRHQLRDQQEQRQLKLNQSVTAKEVAGATLARLGEQRRQVTDRQSDLATAVPESLAVDDRLAGARQAAETALAAVEERYVAAKAALPTSGDAATVFAKLEQGIADGRPHPELAVLAARLKPLLPGTTAEQPDLTVVLAERDEAAKRLADLRVQEAGQIEAVKLQQRQQQRHQREAAALVDQLTTLDQEKTSLQAKVTAETKTIETVTAELDQLSRQLKTLEGQIKTEEQSSLGENEELDQREQTLKTKQKTHEVYRRELADRNVDLAKLETRLDDLDQEAKAKLGAAFPPAADEALPEPAAGEDTAIDRLERKMLELGGIEPAVTAEFKEVDERFSFLSGQADDLRRAKADLEKLIRQLERQSRTIFKESFSKINWQFGRHFAKLFGGGRAELLLIEDRADEDEAVEPGQSEFGIDIKAVPPGKRVQNLSMLSGGERALTSVALLFAILTVNPSPFVMLDEVDAALDEANTARFADLLGELAAQTQFVVVTHNRDTMHAAAMLYGVTMDESGISTMLSIKLPEAELVAGVS